MDRIRTTNNLLGDLYATVFVEHFSQDELKAMDYHHPSSGSCTSSSPSTPSHCVQVGDDNEDEKNGNYCDCKIETGKQFGNDLIKSEKCKCNYNLSRV